MRARGVDTSDGEDSRTTSRTVKWRRAPRRAMLGAMTQQPRGTVTFLLSDIERSTRLVAALGARRYATLLERHRSVLRAAFADEGGYEVDCEGDGFVVAFASASGAVRAAASAQRGLAAQRWPSGFEPRIRMGIH